MGSLGTVLAFLAAFVGIAAGIPLAQRRISRNGLYGYRFSYTLEDDDIWYTVNEMGGRHFIAAGCAFFVVGLLSLLILGNAQAQLWLANLLAVAVLAGLLVTFAIAYRRAEKMAEAKGLKKGHR